MAQKNRRKSGPDADPPLGGGGKEKRGRKAERPQEDADVVSAAS